MSVSNCMFLNRTLCSNSNSGCHKAEVKVLLTVKSEGSLGGRLSNFVAARELMKNCPTHYSKSILVHAYDWTMKAD